MADLITAMVLTFLIGCLAVTAAVALSKIVDWADDRAARRDPLAIASAVGVLRERTIRNLTDLEAARVRREQQGGAR